MSNDNHLVTPAEAARLLDVTTQAVYLRIDSGKLQRVFRFGRILVLKREVEKWRKERIESATAQLAGASE